MATSQNPNPSRNDPQMEHEEEQRNWAELNRDILLVIFRMVGVIDVLMSAELVCRSWQKAAEDEPELWRRIDMTKDINRSDSVFNKLKDLTLLAVDRSRGRLEEFWVNAFCGDYLLRSVCDRHVLKSLRLIDSDICTSSLVEAVRKQPLLEELEITFRLAYFGQNSIASVGEQNFIASVGEALPNLKQFRSNRVWIDWHDPYGDEDIKNATAFGIAKTMHQLRHLQLVGNKFTNKGLTAILEGCPHLESLDIRRCNNVKMDPEMRARCARLTTFKSPDDSLDDYQYPADMYYEMLDDYIDTDDLVYDYDYD